MAMYKSLSGSRGENDRIEDRGTQVDCLINCLSPGLMRARKRRYMEDKRAVAESGARETDELNCNYTNFIIHIVEPNNRREETQKEVYWCKQNYVWG